MRTSVHPLLSAAGPACAGLGLLLLLGAARLASSAEPSAPAGAVLVLAIEGPLQQVEWMRRDVPGVWAPASLNQRLVPGDWIRTGPRNRVLLKSSDLETFWLYKRTTIRIPEPRRTRRALELLRGVIYFFHRDKPDELEIRTRLVSSVVRGTEFIVSVDDDDTTTLTLLDGEVALTNEFGRLTLRTGQQARTEPGKAPTLTAVLNAANIIQWFLYYPGVLDPDELPLTADQQKALRESLDAYRRGDLLAALERYPAERQPTSNEERIYLAALLLSVGQVDECEQQLDSLAPNLAPPLQDLAEALRRLIAAVNRQPGHASRNTDSPSLLLAQSYYKQAHAQNADSLKNALALAREAVARSTSFAFAWARVAELEFSFGRVTAARAAVDRSLSLAPRNAQALALKGFLAAAHNDILEAIRFFDEAIAIDPALGNAWLGRGLCRIRKGDAEAGRLDLQVAATVEPQRALLRSYLGKAFSHTGDNSRAAKELELAKELDPNDPTAWLYSALLNQQRNRINDAVRDLERSQDLNQNRATYRSRLLLDQDRAVRGANLATVYRDAGMADVSLREAVRAVNADYANYSAHLFLANSYNELRDPRQINLRYETPWLSEYLVANLLAPVGAGTLSSLVSQQEYSRLFERNRLGISSATEYLSRGDWFQSAVQYGVYNDLSYAAEMAYRSETGQRPNNDLRQLTTSLKLKQQLTPVDSMFFQATYYDADGGDLHQYYDPAQANPDLRTEETQEPLLLAGYHHQWSPGVHTLFLAGHVEDSFKVQNPRQQTLLLWNQGTAVLRAAPIAVEQDYRSQVEISTAEIQQILQRRPHTLIFGGRYQTGDFDTRNETAIAPGSIIFDRFEYPSVFFEQSPQEVRSDFERSSLYTYYHLQVLRSLLLVAGLSYDYLTLPTNFRFAPLAEGEESTERLSPKAGFIWTPTSRTAVRAGYSRSLGGAAFDQSFRLEPSQVAGFSQAFRSVIPESIAGANAGARFESLGVSFEQQCFSNTYVAIGGEHLRSEVNRTLGVFNRNFPQPVTPPFIFQSSTRQHLDYEERTATATINQLLSDEWAVGAQYRVSSAELDITFRDLPASAQFESGLRPHEQLEALLHNVNLFVLFNHPSGFFSQAQAIWFAQDNYEDASHLPGDDFWQFNAFVGYRFARRRIELRVGVLNIADQDYRLNPLNLTAELPRDRTAVASLRFNF